MWISGSILNRLQFRGIIDCKDIYCYPIKQYCTQNRKWVHCFMYFGLLGCHSALICIIIINVNIIFGVNSLLQYQAALDSVSTHEWLLVRMVDNSKPKTPECNKVRSDKHSHNPEDSSWQKNSVPSIATVFWPAVPFLLCQGFLIHLKHEKHIDEAAGNSKCIYWCLWLLNGNLCNPSNHWMSQPQSGS